jgi:hypothetical protein
MNFPTLKKREEPLVVATQTIYSRAGDSLKPWIARGEVVPRSDPRVKNHPEAFEDAPKDIWRGTAPRPNEPVSIARATFVASDGKWVGGGARFYPYDGLVRAHPQFFYTELPRD